METNTGIIFEKTDEKYVCFFHQNEKTEVYTKNSGIYVSFYFWLQNTMQYYERKYQLLQDALSNIGGITRIILSMANVINYIISRYVILVDSEELFFAQNERNFKEGLNNISSVERQIKKDIDNTGSQMNLHFNNNQSMK